MSMVESRMKSAPLSRKRSHTSPQSNSNPYAGSSRDADALLLESN